MVFVPYKSQWCNLFLSWVHYGWWKSYLKNYDCYAHAMLVCRTPNLKALYKCHQQWQNLPKHFRPNTRAPGVQRCLLEWSSHSLHAWYSSTCWVMHICDAPAYKYHTWTRCKTYSLTSTNIAGQFQCLLNIIDYATNSKSSKKNLQKKKSLPPLNSHSNVHFEVNSSKIISNILPAATNFMEQMDWF